MQVAEGKQMRGKQMRGPFETMRVSLTVDRGNPFRKKLVMVDSSGDYRTLELIGASAEITPFSGSHPQDVQPSFADKCITIRGPMTTLIVVNPTAEDQYHFLDQLRYAGCIVRDLQLTDYVEAS